MSTEAQTLDRGNDAAQDAGHDDGVHYTTKNYVVIGLILGVITALEVTLSYVDTGPVFIPALLILMAMKFFAVVFYFMHLKFDHPIFSVLFYMGLSLAVFVFVAAMATMHFF